MLQYIFDDILSHPNLDQTVIKTMFSTLIDRVTSIGKRTQILGARDCKVATLLLSHFAQKSLKSE